MPNSVNKVSSIKYHVERLHGSCSKSAAPRDGKENKGR